MADTLHHRLVEIALQEADGTSFEKFAQSLYAALEGRNFVPLGGMHDGGAEGFIDERVFEDERPGTFLQASIRDDYRTKIRQTARRLREVGRELKRLIYITNQVVPYIDTEEEKLSEELGLIVRIRDQKYITSRINDSTATIQAFNSYMAPHLEFLNHVGAARTIAQSPNLPSRTLCVFLGQELQRRRGNTDLLEAVTDSLILWSLEETDPDAGMFLTRSEIRERIESALPAARHFVRGVLDVRLQKLTSRAGTNGREIRWYRKGDRFCLPHETRLLVRQENAEDEQLKQQVSHNFRSRIPRELENTPPHLHDTIISTCHRTLEISFETQGLEMAYFVSNNEPENYVTPSIGENIEKALDEADCVGEVRQNVKDAALKILRETFYASSTEERVYLSKLSHTYTLLFVLKNDPKVVEYFRGMSSQFQLYVGADIIIRMLSEHYLNDADQSMANTLRILADAGSKLILTEKALEEIWTHMKAADLEFKNHYKEIEPRIDMVFARHIDRILIRSYFYSRLEADTTRKRPSGWPGFIENFCSFRTLHDEDGKEQLRDYLCEKFKMDFETTEETEKGLDQKELEDLVAQITASRRRSREQETTLARNDALHVLRVYSKRLQSRERSHSNPYGFRTWWLTQETAIKKATGATVAKRAGALYMMRPEFLLNFIALAPSAESVRQSFGSIFPTILGVKLSNRMRPEIFKKVISDVKEAYAVDETRASIKLAELSNRLKGDLYKEYEAEFARPMRN